MLPCTSMQLCHVQNMNPGNRKIQYCMNRFLGFISLLLIGCSGDPQPELESGCDKCDQINQNNVEATFYNYLSDVDPHNDISPEGLEAMENEKENLMGSRILDCGCRGDELRYTIMGTRGKDFELIVELLGDSEYLIVGIEEAKISKP